MTESYGSSIFNFLRTLHIVLHICCCSVVQSCLTLCNPMDCSLPGSSVHGDSPGKNTGVGSHFFLQIFLTQGLNLRLLHCRWILYRWATCKACFPYWLYQFLSFPDSWVGKASACNAGDPGSIPGSGRSAGEGIGYPLQHSWASLVAQLVKNTDSMQKTWVWSLGWEDLLEKGKATYSSTLAWKIPWTEEPGGLHSMGLQRVRHDWVTSLSFSFVPVYIPTNTACFFLHLC